MPDRRPGAFCMSDESCHPGFVAGVNSWGMRQDRMIVQMIDHLLPSTEQVLRVYRRRIHLVHAHVRVG